MKMPFGKYRGSRIEELPSDYLAWLSTLYLHQPLRSAIRTEWARRAGYACAEDFLIRVTGDDRKVARQIVESGRRALAKNAHPDAGGNHGLMTKINCVADGMLETLG